MKKIIIYTLLISLFVPVYGSNIQLNSSISEVQISDTFDITIDIEEANGSDIQVETISGIENFDILGQSRSQRFININGQVSSQDTLLFTLQPKSLGVYTLGPVNAISSGATLDSNTIQVKVVDGISVINQDSTDNGESSVDILDIFDSSDRKFSFNYLPLFIVVFFIVFFMLIQKLLRKPEDPIALSSENTLSEYDILKRQLISLKKDITHLEKSDFYGQFNTIMRDYFSFLGYKNTHKMTLREIQNLGISNEKILGIFTQSYTREFDTKSDTNKTREKLIDDFIQLL